MLHGTKAVVALAVDPSGARLATGSVDYDVSFWDFAGKIVGSLNCCWKLYLRNQVFAEWSCAKLSKWFRFISQLHGYELYGWSEKVDSGTRWPLCRGTVASLARLRELFGAHGLPNILLFASLVVAAKVNHRRKVCWQSESSPKSWLVSEFWKKKFEEKTEGSL